MLFNSFVFVGFLAIVLPVYYRLSHRAQNTFLVMASYVFYGFWDWRFTSLLAISTLVDFFAGRGIAGARTPAQRNLWLVASLTTNLGILGFFKYCDFFVTSAAALLDKIGLSVSPPLLQIVLPVGISFYTFQTMAYTIDVYRGRQEATRDFVAFALYVSYFPQLVAGPIERASRLLPQITQPRRVGQDQWATGAQLLLWGYVKKVAIADSLAPHVDIVFANPMNAGGADLWIGLYCFAVQIYCDFSGYSDIARGVSRLFGIELIENFRQPYLARNITEFWRRWHISLSTWLRDYLYIPLGGNRRGVAYQYRNLILTMLLGGLWHGAGWKFVAWGGLHGVYLALHKVMTQGRKIGQERPPDSLPGWCHFAVKAVATFHLVCLSWVFFRAPDFACALDYLGGLMLSVAGQATGPGGSVIPEAGPTLAFYAVLVLLMDLGSWLADSESPVTARLPWWVRGTLYAAGALILAFVRESTGEAFIYFQF